MGKLRAYASVATASLLCVALYGWRRYQRWRARFDAFHSLTAPHHMVRDEAALRAVVPVKAKNGKGLSATKVRETLDDQMLGFIRLSPFLMLATADRSGLPFVSPKGDQPGFVEALDSQTLLLPDRPGNNILMGLTNILLNPRVGICFEIPGNQTTLRVGGIGVLSKDPELLERCAARGRDATMVIIVRIEYAFFHCAKAYLRSQLWKPDTWPDTKYRVTFAPYFPQNTENATIDKRIDDEYGELVESIAGRGVEPL